MKQISLFIIFIILNQGCNHQPSFEPQNISIYKRGYQDGCKTAHGNYSKSHTLFNNNLDYHEGWFTGRNKCDTSSSR